MVRSLSVRFSTFEIFSRSYVRTCQFDSLGYASICRQRHISISAKQCSQICSFNEHQVPFGKQLKDEFKRKRIEKQIATNQNPLEKRTAKLDRWDLTVGLEIHAQLNTAHKLFSTSTTSIDETPNTHVSFFDLAVPGSLPLFQAATLVPAVRAALALNCEIQNESQFDRKHYFYADQPAGYQITQYYKPLAVDGFVSLFEYDGIEPLEKCSTVGIKQVQLEQDTAKSISHPPSTTLVDCNRVGHPLIEIITAPEIYSPQGAAACARKIQSILQAVNAIFTGMEMGGLRVDVNVSVSPKGSPMLGQRTEIKNLSSFKAVELSIIAERDRQIDILENGGIIVGETRGWTLGDTATTKLRGKEGEVDYRFMPDPDVPPLLIDNDLIKQIKNTLPGLPDTIISELVHECGLTPKDAKTIVVLDDGQRLDYFDDICKEMSLQLDAEGPLPADVSKTVGNWVIHELGGLLSASACLFSPETVPAASFAAILVRLHKDQITGTSAKRLLATVFEDNSKKIENIIEAENMSIQRLSEEEYCSMARCVMEEHPDKVHQIRMGQKGKIKFLVGQMMRKGNGTVVALKAEAALTAELIFSKDQMGGGS